MSIISVKHGYNRSCIIHTDMHVVQLGLRIVFTAVWAQLPSVSETRVALRVTFERLSLPLGSSFLIIAPPERSFGPDLQRQRDTTQCKKRLPLKPYRFTTVTSVSYLKRKRQVLSHQATNENFQ